MFLCHFVKKYVSTKFDLTFFVICLKLLFFTFTSLFDHFAQHCIIQSLAQSIRPFCEKSIRLFGLTFLLYVSCRFCHFIKIQVGIFYSTSGAVILDHFIIIHSTILFDIFLFDVWSCRFRPFHNDRL